MNLCLVGYGAIAEKHMEAFSTIDGVRPHVLVGRRVEPANEFAGKWGFDHFTLDLDEALDDGRVDAVVITSPNQFHAEQAERSLAAGKHVLLEIPMALSLSDAERVTELSRRVDRQLMVAHTMRYFPAIQELRRRVECGELMVHSIVGFFGLMRRANVTSSGAERSWTDNLLWHFGAHMVDIGLWITDSQEAESVFCAFGPEHPAQGVMDMSLSMTLSSGALFTLAQSYHIDQLRWRLTAIGQQATLDFDNGALYGSDGAAIIPPHSITDLWEQNCEFVNAVREGRDTAITGEDVLPAMRILQQAQSCAEGLLAKP